MEKEKKMKIRNQFCLIKKKRKENPIEWRLLKIKKKKKKIKSKI